MAESVLPSPVLSGIDRKSPVTIIGGGIGGLAMANALQHVGIPFELYEQADELTEVGAGIGLNRSTVDLLAALGLEEQVRARAMPIREVFFTDGKLNVRRKLFSSFDGVCIHRAALIDILKSRLPAESLHLSRRVARVRSDAHEAEVFFDDGTSVSSSCTIAADGIHSAVRKSLFPSIGIRYINQTIWRGISRADVPEFMRHSYIEAWDERLRFLTVPIGPEEMFWLAVQAAPPGGRDNPETVREDLMALFGTYHPAFLELVAQSRNFLRNDMADLGTKRRPWHHNTVAFLGDAIHATTPNLAQGGCQAIEDAVCLALCLRRHGADLEMAYRTYHRLRRKKVSYIVGASWAFGVAAHSRNPVRYHLFKSILQYQPPFMARRQVHYLGDVSYLSQVDDAGLVALPGLQRAPA
jgi:2-polyprenyl-6-methoxyphenol hydroxylase-like FAD-dependent oxidoreductase